MEALLFSVTTAAKELENTSVSTIDGYIEALEMSNLIYLAKPMEVGSKAQLGYFRKAKDNQKEVDVVVELPREKILCEVKYRHNSHIPVTDAIVELCKDEKSKVTNAFLITKQLDDFGIAKHETKVPILRIPAIAFLYLLGKAEADGQNGKM